MVSTFHGLEVAKRGLFTQQSALYTTGHNISNANTPGYTRQRVNFEQTGPYPAVSRNRPEIPGQMGSGVQAGSIERVRVEFLDLQFRNENNKTGYYESMANSLAKMEEIMNEPSEQGLAKTMDRFWQSLQDLATHPEANETRTVVRQRGIAVAETFNYLSNSINGLRQDVKNEINVTTKEINSLARQINSLNKQIAEVEPHGILPNDLYDERDRLVDQLSGLVDIKVSPVQNSKSASDMATGVYHIEIVGENNQSLFQDGSGNSVALVDGNTITYTQLDVKDEGADHSIHQLALKSQDGELASVSAEDFGSMGKLRGFIDSYGYETSDGETVGVHSNMIEELDNLAFTYAQKFNEVHESGTSLIEIDNKAASAISFFGDSNDTFERKGYASRMEISRSIEDSVSKIAASVTNNKGNGENALNLAGVGSVQLDFDQESGTSSFNDYYQGIIGEMAVNSQEVKRMVNNANVLKQSVEQQRQSVSSVSLDEEMANMVKFQHAYNAAARNITVVDEMIDRIINQMGRVGR